jgi:aquaporin Z
MGARLLVEAIGTLALMFTVAMVATSPVVGMGGPLAVGCVLAAVIFAGGHVSGAHYNPAPSTAVFLLGRKSFAESAAYVGVQIAAALAATAVVMLVFRPEPPALPPVPPPPGPSPPPDWLPVLVAEFFFTFLLVWVILQVALAAGTKGNSFFGVAIAFVVVAGAFTVGPLTHAAFNPAVTLGLCLLEKIAWPQLWVYLVAQLAAAFVAAVVFRLLNPVATGRAG